MLRMEHRRAVYPLAMLPDKPTQGKRERAAPAGHAYTMQLAMFTPHAAGHSGADTPTRCAYKPAHTAHNVNRADQLRPLATMPDKPTLHSRHRWQQCHRPAIARTYQNRNRHKNNCVKVY